MLSAWLKKWYIFQVKAFAFDTVAPFRWDATVGRLRATNLISLIIWVSVWVSYFTIYFFALAYNLSSSMSSTDRSRGAVGRIMLQAGYASMLFAMTLAMYVMMWKRHEIVDIVNLLLNLDQKLKGIQILVHINPQFYVFFKFYTLINPILK